MKLKWSFKSVWKITVIIWWLTVVWFIAIDLIKNNVQSECERVLHNFNKKDLHELDISQVLIDNINKWNYWEKLTVHLNCWWFNLVWNEDGLIAD